jgi:1-acyl-sn-glycerol-3-phosphate acyltransferase
LAEASVAVTIPQPGHGPRVDRIERAAFECEGRAVPAALNVPADDANVISFVSVGTAIPRHEVRIANDSGGDAGERVEGQLWFRGPSATRGYYRNDAATAALFPQGAAEGWINSCDRAYQAEGEIYITGRVKDIIIHAGRNLYPHEIEDVVAHVPGVRKGCVVAFGAADRTTGTERLVVVAETRERDQPARARIAQAITAQISTAMGLPPDVVTVVPPNTIPKTSSGKLQRDATKKKFLDGELGSTAPPVWLQITRLAVASSAGRIRPALRRAAEIVYGCYAAALFGVWIVPAWLLVLAAPSRRAAARLTTAALKVYLALAGWRVRVEGREHFQKNLPCVFVSNHTSYADVLVLMAALGVNYHFVAKNEVASMPFVRTFLRKLGHFAFNREDSRARLHQAGEIEQALLRGESVFVFPEGTFTAQAGVRPFQLGAFKAAIDAKRPVVPVALNGTRRALRDGTTLPRLSRITITICPPIFPQAGAPDWHEIVRVRDATREMIARYAGEPLL